MKIKKESIDEKIDNLAVMVAKGFDGVHKKFGEVHKEFGEVHKEFGEVHKEIDGMHKEIKEFREEVNQSFENHIKDVRTDYDSLSRRVSVVERKVMH